MAPVMTVESEARSLVHPRVVPPPPSSRTLGSPRSLTVPTPSPRAPDSLRPVAMPAAGVFDTGPQETPPTAITMRTYAVEPRPTATWAAAFVVLGILVGMGSAVFGRGSAADVAAWLDSGRAAAAARPPRALTDSFTTPPSPPAQTAPAVATAPAVERPAEHVGVERGDSATNEALAALAATPAHGERGETAAPSAPSRPTFIAPSSHASHHWRAPVREPAAFVPAAVTAPVQEASLASLSAPAPAPAPPPAPRATSRHSKKGADDDMQAASASDALARAQLEAALR